MLETPAGMSMIAQSLRRVSSITTVVVPTSVPDPRDGVPVDYPVNTPTLSHRDKSNRLVGRPPLFQHLKIADSLLIECS